MNTQPSDNVKHILLCGLYALMREMKRPNCHEISLEPPPTMENWHAAREWLLNLKDV